MATTLNKGKKIQIRLNTSKDTKIIRFIEAVRDKHENCSAYINKAILYYHTYGRAVQIAKVIDTPLEESLINKRSVVLGMYLSGDASNALYEIQSKSLLKINDIMRMILDKSIVYGPTYLMPLDELKELFLGEVLVSTVNNTVDITPVTSVPIPTRIEAAEVTKGENINTSPKKERLPEDNRSEGDKLIDSLLDW